MSLAFSQVPAYSQAVMPDIESEYLERQTEIERNFIRVIVSMMTNYGATGDPKDCNIAMLTAYFDESGIHKGDHLCVVAGFVGNQTQWENFMADWLVALKPRTQLHMKKLRWDQHPAAVARSLEKLGPIPRKRHLKPVFAGMWMRDYKATLEGQVRAKYTNPYMMCAQAAMGTVMNKFADRNDLVAFFFDRQDLHKKTLSALHDVVFKIIDIDPRVERIETITRPEPKSKLVRNICVDPADFLAYEIHEYFIDSKSFRSQAGLSILGPDGIDGIEGGIYTKERLQEASDLFKSVGMVDDGGQAKITPEIIAWIAQMKKRARS